METSEFLARHHRRVVDDFIESVLDELDLGDLERNVLGVALRREVETELVPGIVAVQAVFYAADAETLGKALPEWLNPMTSAMPGESQFLTEMGRCLDPAGYGPLTEDLGVRPGESEVRRAFEAQLWEMAPCVTRSAGSVTCKRPGGCRASCCLTLFSSRALASFASARFLALYFFRYSRIRALWTSHIIVLPPPT